MFRGSVVQTIICAILCYDRQGITQFLHSLAERIARQACAPVDWRENTFNPTVHHKISL
jgi:hypothetical protein